MRTPKSAQIICPITWSNLGKVLDLDEDMVCVLIPSRDHIVEIAPSYAR